MKSSNFTPMPGHSAGELVEKGFNVSVLDGTVRRPDGTVVRDGQLGPELRVSGGHATRKDGS